MNLHVKPKPKQQKPNISVYLDFYMFTNLHVYLISSFLFFSV